MEDRGWSDARFAILYLRSSILVWKRGLPLRPLFGKLFAGEPDNFHGADDAARILSVNFLVGRRVEFAQFAQQRFERRGFQFSPQSGTGGRRFTQAFEKRLEIKPGAAAENRRPPARLDFGHRLFREANELRCVEGFVQIANVNEVMRHAGAFGRRWLGRADVQPAINLHRVGGDDFATDFFRERECNCRFSNRRRPGEEDGERMEDGGWRMEGGCVCHLQSSIFHPHFYERGARGKTSARGRRRTSANSRSAPK